jgi:hypothetical protein
MLADSEHLCSLFPTCKLNSLHAAAFGYSGEPGYYYVSKYQLCGRTHIFRQFQSINVTQESPDGQNKPHHFWSLWCKAEFEASVRISSISANIYQGAERSIKD